MIAREFAEEASLKRVAWAFGCAKKGSEEEWILREALLRKVAETLTEEELRAFRAPHPQEPEGSSNG